MKRFLASLGLLALTLFLGIVLFAYFDKDIDITINNVSDELLKDVVVRAGGDIYSLGDIPAGGSVRKGIDPTKDSMIGVSHRGFLNWLTVDAYIIRGFTGEVTLELGEASLTKTFDSIDYN